MKITVNNKTDSTINVSINRWGTSGKTKYYEIKADHSEDWDRSDDRGFVMYLKESGSIDGPYYVRTGDPKVVTFNKDSTVDGAIEIDD
jgi:hypothetical protein